MKLHEITGWPKECFHLAGADGYGTPRPHRYHIYYSPLAAHLKIKDQARPGYSYVYPSKFYQAFDAGMRKLEAAGYIVTDPIVLSHVHGFFSRTIKLAT